MNLLIPFIEFDLIVWLSLIGGAIGRVGYVARTPFKIDITKDHTDGELKVWVNKRSKVKWPAEADPFMKTETYEDSYFRTRTREVMQDYQFVGSAKIDDPNRDERIIEHIVTAKDLIKTFKSGGELKQMEKIAKRALKS